MKKEDEENKKVALLAKINATNNQTKNEAKTKNEAEIFLNRINTPDNKAKKKKTTCGTCLVGVLGIILLFVIISVIMKIYAELSMTPAERARIEEQRKRDKAEEKIQAVKREAEEKEQAVKRAVEAKERAVKREAEAKEQAAKREAEEKVEAEAIAKMTPVQKHIKENLDKSWDGRYLYHFAAERAIKEVLNDPSSFDCIGVTNVEIYDQTGDYEVFVKYRAKNAFGATIISLSSVRFNLKKNTHSVQ